MANPEHLEILKQGVEVWNRWREASPEIRPDLNRACLSDEDLGGIDLFGAHILEADLSRACLRGANLRDAHLGSAGLRGADCSGARLSWANLSWADLGGAELRGAWLDGANLIGADVTDANFDKATVGRTIFEGNDLSRARGLESVEHLAPSAVSVDTIYRSKGEIPVTFLRGCGLPEAFITQMTALMMVAGPVQFYSCFISYSSKDQEFAERLHDDLQAKGVRVWFAPQDMPIGARIRPTIDESIRVYDKLLLVLSEHSVSSQWVEQEVETALTREREQGGRTVLFPVRIDDAVMETKAGWPALLKNTRHVGDFTRWKEHDSYRRAFDRLLRDLRAGA